MKYGNLRSYGTILTGQLVDEKCTTRASPCIRYFVDKSGEKITEPEQVAAGSVYLTPTEYRKRADNVKRDGKGKFAKMETITFEIPNILQNYEEIDKLTEVVEASFEGLKVDEGGNVSKVDKVEVKEDKFIIEQTDYPEGYETSSVNKKLKFDPSKIMSGGMLSDNEKYGAKKDVGGFYRCPVCNGPWVDEVNALGCCKQYKELTELCPDCGSIAIEGETGLCKECNDVLKNTDATTWLETKDDLGILAEPEPVWKAEHNKEWSCNLDRDLDVDKLLKSLSKLETEEDDEELFIEIGGWLKGIKDRTIKRAGIKFDERLAEMMAGVQG